MHTNTIDTLRALADEGVGTSNNERLALLLLLEAEEPMRTSAVGDRIGLSKGAMTALANRLVAAKLVRRVLTEDRRSIFLEPTARAAQKVRKVGSRA